MAFRDMSDEELNALTMDQIERIREEKAQAEEAAMLMAPSNTANFFSHRGASVVAMGDSWFDYSIAGLDTLDFLDERDEYRLIKRGNAGDTLENMVLGTDYDRDFDRREARLERVLRDIASRRANVVLVSGGGNDIAGPELDSLLSHQELEGGRPDLRPEALDALIEQIFRPTYQQLIDRVAEVRPECQIFAHGYGNAPPNGDGVGVLLNFAGPWLKPAFTRKAILDPARQAAIVVELIARFNIMLGELAAANPTFHHVDVRGLIGDNDWVNELHVNAAAYRRIADALHARFVDHVSGPLG